MEKVLSEEEISALFSAMSSEDRSQENPAERDGPKVVDYDFHRGSRVAHDQLKVLRHRFDRQGCAPPRQIPSRHDADQIAELVKTTHIQLSGEIRGSKLTIDGLLRMSVGDIIELKDSIGDPMVLCVGGIPKFKGKILHRRGKKVFSISGRTAV